MAEVEKLDICVRIKTSLKKLKLSTFNSILHLTGPVGGLSLDDVTSLKLAVSKKLNIQHPRTALELYKTSGKEQKLTTGCEVLDQALRGGILCGSITEIAGESATGKTQFGLQLSLTAQLSPDYGGLDAGTLYICTEDAFPSKRLYQMIKNFTSRHGNRICNNGNLGDKIFIEHVADFDGIMGCLSNKAPVLLSSGSIKLVVLDSVAAPFRSDYSSGEMIKRAQHINSLGALLSSYGQQYQIPVVCINQVTTSMKEDSSELVPSLGLTWSNHVTTRIMLSRTDRSVVLQQDSVCGPLETVVRNMEIIFAPHLPNMIVPYVVDHEGMKGFR